MTTSSQSVAVSAVGVALDEAKLGSAHIWLVVIIGLGSLFEVVELSMTGVYGTVFGDDVRSGAMEANQLALLLATTSIGAVIGAPLLGAFGDRFGRRPALSLALGLAVVFSVWGALSTSMDQLIAARLGASLGIGAYIPLAATYLADVIPERLRGRALMINAAIAGIGGVVCGFLTRWFGEIEPWGLEGWRCTMLAGALGAGAIAIAMARIPESPRWLAARGQMKRALRELKRFKTAALPMGEVSSHGEAAPIGKVVWTRAMFAMLAILVLLHFAVPWCTTGYTSFTGWVFAARGYEQGDALVLQGIIMVGVSAGALLGMVFVDRIGRATLLFWNAVAIIAAAALFTLTSSVYIALGAGLVMAMAGAVYMWMLILWGAELFPPLARAQVSSILYGVNRGASMLVPFVMLPMLTQFGEISLYGTIVLMFALSAGLVIIAAAQARRTLGGSAVNVRPSNGIKIVPH